MYYHLTICAESKDSSTKGKQAKKYPNKTMGKILPKLQYSILRK